MRRQENLKRRGEKNKGETIVKTGGETDVRGIGEVSQSNIIGTRR